MFGELLAVWTQGLSCVGGFRFRVSIRLWARRTALGGRSLCSLSLTYMRTGYARHMRFWYARSMMPRAALDADWSSTDMSQRASFRTWARALSHVIVDAIFHLILNYCVVPIHGAYIRTVVLLERHSISQAATPSLTQATMILVLGLQSAMTSSPLRL